MQLAFNNQSIPVFTMFAVQVNESKSVYLQAETFISESDRYKFTGILVPDANSNYLNPWFFANLIIKHSKSLIPFIAVNSLYTHPFYTAKYISNLSSYLNRPLYVNYITGTALFDSTGLGDSVNHDSKYERLGEYCSIVDQLLKGGAPVSFQGAYYALNNVILPESLSSELQPINYIAGKSDASLKLTRETGSGRLCMAIPENDFNQSVGDYKTGFHFGIIAREDEKSNYKLLAEYAPADDTARKIKEFTTKRSAVIWKKELLAQSKVANVNDIYNLTPFINGHSDVPYLVGSIENVAKYILGYLIKGLNSIVIEVPMTGYDEFKYINQVFLSVQQLLDTDENLSDIMYQAL
ncbi:LLM class flavin-dependent oxidoreductase [Pedobacter sp. R20-19]|uniref:LLM class flavin-dependent oxidoreductase n=1 Tax=Pedobacter sp. R20-19 TaxID=1270196 RepID=UPI0004936624|nr:LLM class flavin-dependent oxidoreductase [Pedobacter sp. R20-19]